MVADQALIFLVNLLTRTSPNWHFLQLESPNCQYTSKKHLRYPGGIIKVSKINDAEMVQ